MPYVMYLPDGSCTNDIDKFIDIYSDKYFHDYAQNTQEKENEIIDIVKKGMKIQSDDVVTLMRWKTGDENKDGDIVNCFGKRISKDIGQKTVIAINFGNMGQSPISIYKALYSEGMTNMGTVYLLTLVWAISEMKYPIYDKFAKVAITAICNGNKPDKTNYKYPPDKYKFDCIEKMYDEYQCQLTQVFGNRWKEERKIDQALWCYGHQTIG